MKKVLKIMQKVQMAAGGVFLTIFLVTVVIQMFSRYVGITATWTEEVSMYAFIWAAFMGAGAMVYEKQHFAFTSIRDMMKNQRTKKLLGIFIAVIMFIFSVLMAYYGVMITKQFWNYKWVSLPMLNRGPTWLCLPLCGITSAIYLAGQIVEDAAELKKGGE